MVKEDAGQMTGVATEGESAEAALRKAFAKLQQDEQELRQITDAIAADRRAGSRRHTHRHRTMLSIQA